MFQFYLSSIKRREQLIATSKLPSFNSTLVQLKATQSRWHGCSLTLFQFYLSSIKRNLFQKVNCSETGFNSTLVQLKAVKRRPIGTLPKSFNSTLVQLKVGLELTPFKFKTLFQFYLSSIKSGCLGRLPRVFT